MSSPDTPTAPARTAETLFHRARAMPAEADVRRFLEEACAGDPGLRARVEELLRADAAAGGFLRTHERSGGAAPGAELVGQRIGRYRLLQVIGEGGFGAVYLAQQDEPVRRRVALKIIKPGMDSRLVAARFEAERQALALMDHPHIARVFDGGITEPALGARPYFVMEYVVGDPITDFADAHRLGIADRLALLIQVCEAVQHAHQKGIIHRDLKPSNVLVSMTDGRPFAKVIDFGIAKATGRPLTDKTLFTEHRQLLGTPEYMSPEQAEGSADLDTRTDVYALGVLLYELLTGATPFDAARLRSAAHAELQRIIREEEPPAPSVRLTRDQARLAAAAAARAAEPSRLGAMVRGELDWIVMKALDKDRARRYESPGQLAADVAGYLAGDAISAAPPSAAYRVRKFVRKHRVGSALAALLAVAVVGTAGGLIWALAERGRANLHADRSERIAAAVALFADVQNELSARTQSDDWNYPAPPDAAVGSSFDRLIAALDGGMLSDAPAAELALRASLVRGMAAAGVGQQSLPLLERTVALSEQWLGPDHATTLQLMADVPVLLHQNANEKLDAERLRKARGYYAAHDARLRAQGGPPGTVLQWASRVLAVSSEYGDESWTAASALGEPDTFRYGDYGSAWAPEEASEGEQWISLGFARPVHATAVMVRQTCGNGFVRRVDLIDRAGEAHCVWVGDDPSAAGRPAQFVVTFDRTAYAVAGVKITVDTDHSGAWEEIDAVRLHGDPASDDEAADEAARRADLAAQAAAAARAERLAGKLLARPASLADLEQAVRAEPSLSPVERLAAMAALRERIAAIRAEARRRFEAITAEHITVARVRAAIEADAAMDPRVREALRAMADGWKPSLNTLAWAAVKHPGASETRIAAALDAAIEATAAWPNDGDRVNTLGVAQYRAGRYEEAVATLTRANELNRRSMASDWAFLAMAQFRAGREDEARASLRTLRDMIQDPGRSWSAEAREFLREAEALIEGGPAAPAAVERR